MCYVMSFLLGVFSHDPSSQVAPGQVQHSACSSHVTHATHATSLTNNRYFIIERKCLSITAARIVIPDRFLYTENSGCIYSFYI